MKCSSVVNLFLILALACAGCGGDGGSSHADIGIGGTGAPTEYVKTTGSITGFGSIFVNGIEFDTSASTIVIDGKPGAEADLKLGMVVNITGDYDTGTGIGSALSVEFDDDVQGPVTAISTNADLTESELSILGVTVIVRKGLAVLDGVSFDTLAVADVLEVSGFFESDNVIQATRVEKKSTTEVELKGRISSVDSVAMRLVVQGSSVDYSAADLSDLPGATPAVGQQVEVKGRLLSGLVLATEIEIQDEFYSEDEDRVRIEGLVTNLNEFAPNSFRILGQQVAFSAATFVPAALSTSLANNQRVSVEGPVVAGILQASRVESRQSALLVRAPVQSVAANSITLSLAGGQSLLVGVDEKTRFDDELSTGLLNLEGISPGDYLAVSLIDLDGAYLAVEVTRDEPDHEALQGPVDSFIAGSSVTLLGVTFNVDQDTEFSDSQDEELSSAAFFSLLAVGEVVKIEDERPGDGIADEAEFE